MEIIVKGLKWSNFKNSTPTTSFYIEYEVVGFTPDNKLLLLRLDGVIATSWLYKENALNWIIRNRWVITYHPNIDPNDNLMLLLNSEDIDSRKLAVAIIENM